MASMASFEEDFLASLPPEYRNSEALRESLRTSSSFAKFKESRQRLSRNDVAAWAKSGVPSNDTNRKNKPEISNAHKTNIGVATSSKVSSSAKNIDGTKEKLDPLLKSIQTATRFKTAGNKFFVDKKFESAIKAYTRGVDTLQPWRSNFNGGAPQKRLSKDEASTMVAILSNRAACFLKLGRFQKSIDDCTSVLNLVEHGRHIKALYRRSEAYRALLKYRLAKKDLLRLLELEPGNKSAKVSLREVLQIVKRQKQKEAEEKLQASLTSGACVALVNVLRDQNNDSDSHSNSKADAYAQQKAALETFSSEIGNMLSSVKDGIGNEFFTSGLDIVLLDLVGENAIGEDKSGVVHDDELPRFAASVFKGFYDRLYLLMDEEVPQDGSPHFFGSEYLGLRSHFRALVKTSLTGNKQQLAKVRSFVNNNRKSITWMWVANAYRETCSRIQQRDTNGAFVHALEGQILRSAFIGESDKIFDGMIKQGGLKRFLLERIQVRLKQFALVSALLEPRN